MDKLKIAKSKNLRGNIIEKLYHSYGQDITIAHLKSILSYQGYHSDEEMKKAIFYLTGAKKEYIRLVFNKDNYMDSLIWLTPTGVNLAEGDIKDVGVEIDE